MNAPAHNLTGKLAEWKEQTSFRAFLLGSGEPDGEDISMLLIVLKDHWERIGDSIPDHALDAWEDAQHAIWKAQSLVSEALDAVATDRSDEEDFRELDWKARMDNVRGA